VKEMLDFSPEGAMGEKQRKMERKMEYD